MTNNQLLPEIIKKVGFDFDWDEKKVWLLDIPVIEMKIDQLEWHFDVPFWNTKKGFYDLSPREVIDNSGKFAEEYNRIMKSDLKYPIDIMKNKGEWLILDGLHRLAKAAVEGRDKVKVRKIPKSRIKDILR